MVKRIITIVIISSLIITNNFMVFAEETDLQKEVIGENGVTNNFKMETIDAEQAKEASNTFPSSEVAVYEEITYVEEGEIYEYNNVGRQYSGQQNQISALPKVSSKLTKVAGSENIDPNNAYLVENDYLMQGTISTSDEMRWYAFVLEQKSKVSLLLEVLMLETV